MKFGILIIMMAMVFCGQGTTPDDEQLLKDAEKYFGRIEAPSEAALQSPQTKLDRKLFWDERLSIDGKTACASCHTTMDWGSDQRRYSINARGKKTSRHSQSVLNAMKQPVLRWRGDRNSGAVQAQGSITGSMGFESKEDLVKTLRKLDYTQAFQTAYPADVEPLSARNYGAALEAYQTSLLTPAPFDRFQTGNTQALNKAQKVGLRAFLDRGCVGCHSGPLLGGKLLQRFGVEKDYWLETGSEKIDEGRMSVTKKEKDRYVFRVSMLRNIAKTAPYFHDGSVGDLEDAVRIMGSVQLGVDFSENERKSILIFFESLTGNIPQNFAPLNKW